MKTPKVKGTINPNPKSVKLRKKGFEEKKLEILEGCSNMLARSRSSIVQPQVASSLVLCVDAKLKLLDKRTRMFTEKRIMDVLFEAERVSPRIIPKYSRE